VLLYGLRHDAKEDAGPRQELHDEIPVLFLRHPGMRQSGDGIVEVLRCDPLDELGIARVDLLQLRGGGELDVGPDAARATAR
jgi:hypothetical protein